MLQAHAHMMNVFFCWHKHALASGKTCSAEWEPVRAISQIIRMGVLFHHHVPDFSNIPLIFRSTCNKEMTDEIFEVASKFHQGDPVKTEPNHQSSSRCGKNYSSLQITIIPNKSKKIRSPPVNASDNQGIFHKNRADGLLF